MAQFICQLIIANHQPLQLILLYMSHQFGLVLLARYMSRVSLSLAICIQALKRLSHSSFSSPCQAALQLCCCCQPGLSIAPATLATSQILAPLFLLLLLFLLSAATVAVASHCAAPQQPSQPHGTPTGHSTPSPDTCTTKLASLVESTIKTPP